MTACRPQFGLEEGRSFYLNFDGDRLKPEQTVGETEISDMDRIDVHVC